MTENLREQFLVLPQNLSNHLMITIIPLVIGVTVSLPLAVYVVKHPRLRYPTLTAVSIVQTIPSLALLALMVPLLAALSSLTTWAMGVEFSALGFYPALIALTLYSMLPMVRNTVTGILGVDPAVVEAAEGVGMTRGQVLWKVELPLAAPVIITGIRTATVWVVGIATLATPVGQRCLGNYIFRGLQTRNWTAVVFDALVKGEIDGYVDYTGTIWANYMAREGTAPAETVLREVSRWLRTEHGIRCLGALGFENAYGLAMPRKRARKLGIETIADLVPYASGMKIGGDYEFFGRPEWQKIRDTYGLQFAARISYDSTFMYRAVRQGQVDVISAFTSDGRITAFDLTVLEDPKDTIPPYDAVLLLSPAAASRAGLVQALEPLIGAIPVQLMRRANDKVDREKDKDTVEQAAAWLYDRLFEEND
jgi:ABC-type proline/glycine betaine transport system permease subunit